MANHRSPRSPSTPPAPRTAPPTAPPTAPRTGLSSSLLPSFGGVAVAAPGLPGSTAIPRPFAPRTRRQDGPRGGVRPGRLAAAAIAAGALAAAGPGLVGLDDIDAPTAELTASSASAQAPARPGPAAPDAATSGVLPGVPAARAAAPHAPSLAKAGQRAARPAVAAPRFVTPTVGTFTSGFGARWGTSHQGIDLANRIGTPIVSVADGVVTAAGPASGFGQWVKVRLADGTETVYGHVNRFFVHTGEKVSAGERIAEIGNKGESTGPHLHFEVHTPAGKKINPVPWLAERGISVSSQQD